jgi:hypothetical protein
MLPIAVSDVDFTFKTITYKNWQALRYGWAIPDTPVTETRSTRQE